MKKRRQRWKRRDEVSSSLLTKRGQAQQVGMSLHRLRQSVRVANIPREEFERLVESDHPPTVNQLAQLGRRRAAATTARPKVTATVCPHCRGTGRIP